MCVPQATTGGGVSEFGCCMCGVCVCVYVCVWEEGCVVFVCVYVFVCGGGGVPQVATGGASYWVLCVRCVCLCVCVCVCTDRRGERFRCCVYGVCMCVCVSRYDRC